MECQEIPGKPPYNLRNRSCTFVYTYIDNYIYHVNKHNSITEIWSVITKAWTVSLSRVNSQMEDLNLCLELHCHNAI